MTMQACSQTWMAEAMEDARLGDMECAAFARHTVGCAACSAEVAELAHLREVMTRLPEPLLSDVDRHRRRALLLERANRLMSSSPRRAWKLALAAAAVVLLAAGGAWLHGSFNAPVVTEMGHKGISDQPPTYEVTGLTKADFTREEVGNVARVHLAGGSAEFHVHPLREGQRFMVVLPDGEIEVRGTRFVVAVKNGGTRFVVVTEGKVVLRRSGEHERLLFAGDRWDRPRQTDGDDTNHAGGATEKAHTMAAVSTKAELPPRQRGEMPQHVGGHDRRQVRASAVESLVRSETATDQKQDRTRAADPRRTDTSDSFAVGIAAVRAGHYEDADHLLQAFASKNPADPRCEDAAFLRAVARSRLGDAAGAASLARDYLRRYPNGLRRPEAESLSRRAP